MPDGWSCLLPAACCLHVASCPACVVTRTLAWLPVASAAQFKSQCACSHLIPQQDITPTRWGAGCVSNLEAFLAQIKALNQQTYGDDLDRALAAVAKNQLVMPPPATAAGPAGATNDSATMGSGAEDAAVRQGGEASSVNLDAVRLAEALGVMQEGVRQAALAGVTPEELAPRQQAQAAALGLAEGEKPPGFRVLDRYVVASDSLVFDTRSLPYVRALMVAWGFEWYGCLATPAPARTDIVWYNDKRDVMI